MLMRKDVNNDVTMNPPIRYPLFPSINPEVSTLSDIFRQIPTISILGNRVLTEDEGHENGPIVISKSLPAKVSNGDQSASLNIFS